MRTSDTILLFLAVAAPLASAYMFSADVRVKITNGYYDAKFYYYYDESGNENHAIRYEYSTPTEMTELISFGEGKRYKYCTSCESGFYTQSFPHIYRYPSENATGEKDEANCLQYDRPASDGLKSIWYDAEWNLCKAELRDGKTLIFSNIDQDFNDLDKFNMVGKECPAPVCKRVMDLVFVLDTSFSICHKWNNNQNECDLQDWRKIQNFTQDIINSFDIANDATMVGIVTFCNSGTIQSPITSNKNSLIATIKGIGQMCTSTCIGCGVEKALESFKSISEERKLMNPERMIIFMTDGGNNMPDYYNNSYYCNNYTTKCAKRSEDKCVSYKCVEKECLARDTSKCAKKKCKTYSNKCARCDIYSDTCIKNSTKCSNYSDCTKCSSNWCCSLNKGKCSKSGYGNNCKNTDCSCSEYKCFSYECAEYRCSNCGEYECTKYEDECEEYECTSYGDGCAKEVCAEYECLEYKLECVSEQRGYEGHLKGVLSMLHSGYALGPTHRDIITVAIGVGSEIKPEEVGAVASKLEGQQLYYTIDNFDALTQIMENFVQDTCTSQDSKLEICSDDCLGFCGCEKKCYCPPCDPNDNCTSYSCSTDPANTMSTGCVAKQATCNDDKKCLEILRDPSVAGCCIERPRVCADKDACHITKCSNATGCVYEPIQCPMDNPCKNYTGCDPHGGCQYIDACPDKGKCFNTKCTPGPYGSFECEYETVCNTSDPCMNYKCDPESGECTYKPVVCNASNGCMIATCIDGKCVESINTTLEAECANVENPCLLGFCNHETGTCDVKSIEDASPYCQLCYEKPKDCKIDSCVREMCTSDDGENTKCAVVENYCTSSDPCIAASCSSDRECIRSPVQCTPGPCEVSVCVPNPADPTKPYCNTTSTCKKSDVCTAYSCSADNKTCVATSKCAEKPCQKITGCTEVDGQPVCTYEDIVCSTTNKCKRSFCNAETSKCEEEDISSDCNLGDPCTEYSCDEFAGCISTPITCDDDNPCTDDACIPKNASDIDETGVAYTCSNIPKCTGDLYCQRVTCSIVTGACIYTDYNCEDYNETELDSCHTLECDEETRSCKPVLLASAFLDVCGGCVKTYGTNATLNMTQAKTGCIGSMTMPEFAATVGGAALAGIIIAAIIVAAILAATSTLGARELVKRAKDVSETTMSSNPLYEGNDNEGVNPLYEGDI